MFETTGMDVLFLLARVAFGGVLAFTGVNHFLDTDSMAQYAEYKGLPAPRLSVLGSGGLLIFGGLSIVLGVVPAIGAGLLAVFLVASAVLMHDFWAVPEEDTQDELTHFLKNVYGAGAALAFVVAATVPWPYALNVGL
ncbi:DoxX family protein [Natrarchaeobaculum sulfurireducens]|uniref:Membrane protein, DoxD family n=1 Tax=Natrarchaeobaculum sulfurireducens TaxID=2044521 RepID=A0A346PUG7_9EURY|nr:DoxX family protein [Natrarchaeobaculum sulfurireducens]AXR79392.1 Membrane protein, DoxD family [Natrarchaeobaculum sulfurireducens]AXR83162.1 terminal quinol oxidase subunit [Natrarchaeobaculum sulfurireducens]